MYIIESSQPDNFYLGKNNSSVERQWKLAQAAANQVSTSKNGGKYITWSSAVDWNGFPLHLSYGKTPDGTVVHVSRAQNLDLVQIAMNGKKSYMTKAQFEKHKLVIEPYLKNVNMGQWGINPKWNS